MNLQTIWGRPMVYDGVLTYLLKEIFSKCWRSKQITHLKEKKYNEWLIFTTWNILMLICNISLKLQAKYYKEIFSVTLEKVNS
jgi:hypothetical protein